jgi:hypothetical protein
MDKEQLRQWYIATIGYDPFKDGWTEEEVREMYEEVVALAAIMAN